MEESQTKKSPAKRSFSTEFMVAMGAIMISLATLAVYIYQAKIMQSQQHTSVWPYIEWTMTVSSVDGIYLSVVNKGVGPAIIKSTELYMDGKLVGSSKDMINKLTNGKMDSIGLFTQTIDKRVISPGEELRLFHMSGKRLLNTEFGNFFERIKYKIRYESIYGDCWTSTGLEVQAGCE
jgi:hypothetical protein